MLKVKSETGNDEDLDLLLRRRRRYRNRSRFGNNRKGTKLRNLQRIDTETPTPTPASTSSDLTFVVPSLSKRTFNFFNQDNQFTKFNEDDNPSTSKKRKKPRRKRPKPPFEYQDTNYELPVPDYDEFIFADHRQSVPLGLRPQIVRVDYNLESNRIVAPILLAFMPIFLGVGTALGLLLSGYSFSGSSSALSLGGNNVTVLLTNTVSAPSTSSATNTNTNTNNINTAGRSMSRPQNRKAVKMALDAMMKVFGVHLNPDIVEIIFDNLVNIYKVLTMKPFKMRTS